MLTLGRGPSSINRDYDRSVHEPDSANSRQRDSQLMGRWWRLAIVGALLLVVTACSSGSGPEEDRRFASDVATDEPAEPTEAPIVPDGVLVTQVPPTALAPDAAQGLLEAEGAPAGLLLRNGDGLILIDPARPGERSSITFASQATLLDFAPSPSGGRVVGLLRSASDELTVELRNTRNELIDRWQIDLAETLPASAVADMQSATEGYAVTWTGSTDRVLVTIGGKKLLNLDFTTGLHEVSIPDGFGQIREASWAPEGDRIAMFGLAPSGAGTVWTISPYVDGNSFRQVIPPPADAAGLGSVTQVEWLPDGSGLLYILAQDATDAHPGGNLYRIDLASQQRQVVATPGRGGPSAQIVNFSLSPDGRAVAYTIENPDGESWRFHSLWIRSISSPLHLAVDTGNVQRVSGMAWVGSGFTWQVPVAEGVDVTYDDRRSAPVIIWQPSDALVASPAVSPVAAGATPVASPQATIEASPRATPIASPIASPDPA